MKNIEQNLIILLKKALTERRYPADDISISLSPNCRVAEVKIKSTESKFEILLMERPKNEIKYCSGFAMSEDTASYFHHVKDGRYIFFHYGTAGILVEARKGRHTNAFECFDEFGVKTWILTTYEKTVKL